MKQFDLSEFYERCRLYVHRLLIEYSQDSVLENYTYTVTDLIKIKEFMSEYPDLTLRIGDDEQFIKPLELLRITYGGEAEYNIDECIKIDKTIRDIVFIIGRFNDWFERYPQGNKSK